MIAGVFIALLGQVSFSISNIFQRFFAKEINPLLIILFLYFFITIIAFLVLLRSGENIRANLSFPNFIYLLSIYLCTFLGHIFFLKALKHGQAGIVLAINTSYIFWGYFVNIYLLHEQEILSLPKIILGLIFLMLTIFFSIEKDTNHKIIWNKSVIYAFLNAIGWTVYFCGSNYFIKNNIVSAYQGTFYVNLVLFLCSFLSYFVFIKDIRGFKKILSSIGNLKFFGINAFFNFFGDFFVTLSFAYISGNLSNVIGLSAIIFTAILAYIFLGEKLSKKQLFLITICMIIFILFLII